LSVDALPYSFEPLNGGVVEVARSSGTAAQAAGIIQAARLEADAIETEARERGFAEGYSAGLATAAAELEPARAALAAAADGVRATLAELTAQAERQAAELALALADKVLAAALEVRPELVGDVVAGALRGVTERELKIEVHPDDVAFLTDAAAGVEIVPERRIARGGCVVRTPDGEIDARISEQLERAAEVVRESL
jgi:flagellar assembly protein FliH